MINMRADSVTNADHHLIIEACWTGIQTCDMLVSKNLTKHSNFAVKEGLFRRIIDRHQMVTFGVAKTPRIVPAP